MAKSNQSVAAYLVQVANSNPSAIPDLTNLKLQKLLYYAQGWHLALYGGEPLFGDEIEAWVHGPVVPSVYHAFKKHRWNPIPFVGDDEETDLSPGTIEFLDEVIEAYGGFDAWKLERMTHTEPPWIEAREGLEPDFQSNRTISRDSMLEFFRGLAGEVEE